ncbi:MAG TPA: TMEM175 family protein [Terriglobales bacterium]|nr:TMEM175 family protein [Terriglobales bacterium]
MSKGRLEAFSDGVLAVIITIMVLEMKSPQGASLAALRPLIPIALSYVLSFVYVGIYWNNHHHLLHATERVNGATLWANLHLLFWLSLIPFTTTWVGQNHFESWPVAVYGMVLLLAGVAYFILTKALIKLHGRGSSLATSIGRDRKGQISIAIYAVAIPLAFVQPWISGTFYAIVAIMWLIPDPRIEKGWPDRRG